ncbi:MAG: IS200/IS605 family transposase [Ignavibacteria bacterium]|jgi:putative transposase|nr:IS200/IS605 family transposase [Ignavibacteria bacterium]
MSYVKILIHLVFAVKNREPFFTKEIRPVIFNHILENARKKDLFIEYINGWYDHVHILLSLGKNQTISGAAKLIKGESSNWINNENVFNKKFEWQDDYYAVSIGQSAVDNLIEYIKNQDEHHNKHTFEEEIKNILSRYKMI